jgi:hypothetical protein
MRCVQRCATVPPTWLEAGEAAIIVQSATPAASVATSRQRREERTPIFPFSDRVSISVSLFRAANVLRTEERRRFFRGARP